MADRVPCPQCQRVLEVPAEFRGAEVRCPECEAVFVSQAATEITAQVPMPVSAEVMPGPPSFSVVEEPGDLDVRERGRGFKPGGALALAVKVLFGANALLSVGCMIGDYLQYQITILLVAGDFVPDADIEANNSRQQMLNVARLALLVITAIPFVFWFHRVYSNLKPLGHFSTAFSTGWAAGCWFVPILNLFRPVQIAQEIWRKSDPASNRYAEGSNSALIGFWWAGWIISRIAGNIASSMSSAAQAPEAFQRASLAGIAAELITMVTALLALGVVVAIGARQEECIEAMRDARDDG